jgi:integrase
MFTMQRKPATIDRALVAISQAHKLAKMDPPTSDPIVRETRAGMRRRAGTKQKKADPITVDHLARMIDCLDARPETFRFRDRAILLLGWAGALRRSEISKLDFEDIQSVPEGLVITLKKSKTDQEGSGREIGIPFTDQLCPVSALQMWLSISGIESGPLFRRIWKGGNIAHQFRLSPRSIDRVVRNAIDLAGYMGQFSAHSLRAGFATSAAMAGLAEAAIMDHTGHESIRVFRGYVRRGGLFRDNAVSSVLGVPADPLD